MLRLPFCVLVFTTAVLVSSLLTLGDVLYASEAGDAQTAIVAPADSPEAEGVTAKALLESALRAAAEAGDAAEVLRIMDRDAAIDARNENGNTALHLAAFRGRLDVVDVLIRHSANVTLQDKGGFAPLDWAAANGFEAVADRLLRAGARLDSRGLLGNTALFWAASNGHLAVVETLLAQGADPRETNTDGETPLHRAATEGEDAVCELLIRSGVVIDVANINGETPLQVATAAGYDDVTDLLLAQGAEPIVLDVPVASSLIAKINGRTRAGDSVLGRIRDAGRVRIGYRQSAVPFSYLGPDGVPMGYSIDLCREIVAEVKAVLGMARLPIDWIPVVAETRLTAVAGGRLELECGVTTHTVARRQLVEFSPTIVVTGTQILVKAGSSFHGVKDLGGRKVAVLAATTNAKAIGTAGKEADLTFELLPVQDHPAGLRAVALGDADAYAADHILLHALVHDASNPTDFRIVGDLLSFDPYAIALPRDDSTFKLVVDSTLSRLFRSGEIHAIYRKWLGPLKVPMPALLKAAIRLQALPE